MATPSTALRVKELLRQNGWTTKILAEKTGMSESYLTHIKNGTRRWNQDSLERLAVAFGISPLDLFAQQRQAISEVVGSIVAPENTDTAQIKVQLIPVLGDIPSHPSGYNNQMLQMTSGCRDLFVPVINHADAAMFALKLNDNHLAPIFEKNDLLIVSPEVSPRSGDIAVIEYGNMVHIKAVVKLTYTDDFIVLESVNAKQAPIALVRNKDYFRIIGRVIERHQSFVA
ncbi:MAG: XRE family transcriptional regulator [Candidatus Dependentiae bacterium]|nr:XRE family transcriptional regulator [Candidatus Dependentiae bacterium]